ncbi:hypothetical protein B7486_09720 [cyanobacterium TDX16]|nr:hypothetical protein B7486_09720 [cyanobacterium TDX16]
MPVREGCLTGELVMNKIRIIGCTAVCCLAGIATATGQPPMNSSLTYQGQLKLDGTSVDEPCEYIFRLYDAEEGGTLIAQYGDEVTPLAVEVQKGLFTAALDFGSASFDGGPRWLEVSVRRSATGGAFAALSPRQCITATPYALRALSGGDVTSLDDGYNKGGPGAGRSINVSSGPLSLEGPDGLYVQGNVGIGVTSPTARLDVDGAIRSAQGGFVFPDGTIQTTAAFNLGGGEGPRGGAFWDDDGNSLFTDPSDARVGIGTDSPDFPLHVVGDIFADGSVRSHAFAGESPFIAEAPAGTTRLWIGDGLMGRPPFAALGTTTPQRLPDTLLHLADDFEDPFITLEINPNDNAILPGETGIFFNTGTLGGAILGDLYIDEGDAGTPLFINSFSGNNVVMVPGTGFVGIGTSAPARKLQVVDSSTAVTRFTGTNTEAAVVEFRSSSANSTWEMSVSGSAGAFAGTIPAGTGYVFHQQSGSLAMTLNPTNGFVGFGSVPVPQARIHIGGTPGVDGIRFPDGTVQTTAATGDHGMLMGLLDDDHPQYAHLPGRAGGQVLNGGTAAGNSLTLDSTASASKGPVLINPSGGNVGIGLFAPTSRLHVFSSGFPAATLDSSSTVGTWMALGNSSAGGRYWQLISTGSGNPEGAGKLIISSGTAANLVLSEPMVIQETGEVGLGTSMPEQRLHIVGGTDVNGAAGGFLQLGSSTGLNIGIDNNEIQARSNGVPAVLSLNAEGANVLIGNVIPGGNLGIGLQNPFWAIDVVDIQAVARLTTTTGLNGSVIELRSDVVGPTYIGAVNFNVGAGSTPGQIGYLGSNTMTFRVNGAERIRIEPTGNVGIGSPPPMPAEEALHVNGCVKADCYKLNGEKALEVSPLDAVVAASNLTLIPSPTGTMRVRPLSTGVQNVMVPVAVPTSILGTPQQLNRIRVCYKVNSSTTFITTTRARTSQDNGAFTGLIDNPDDRKSSAWQCYEIMAPMMSAIDGPLFLNLELSAGGTGSTHDIELGRITVFVSDI